MPPLPRYRPCRAAGCSPPGQASPPPHSLVHGCPRCHHLLRAGVPPRGRLRGPAADRASCCGPGSRPRADATPGSGRRAAASRSTWEVADGPRLPPRRAPGDASPPGPSRDHTVKVDADRPRARALVLLPLPAAAASPARSAAPGPHRRPPRTRAGCASGWSRARSYEDGYFAAYRHLADRDDLDAVLHLGDYLYEYGGGERRATVRPHVPAREIVTPGRLPPPARAVQDRPRPAAPARGATRSSSPGTTTRSPTTAGGPARRTTSPSEGDYLDAQGPRPARVRRVDAGAS